MFSVKQWLGVGFSMGNSVVSNIGETMTAGPDGGWIGQFPTGPKLGLWIDNAFLLALGGIPWQVFNYFVLQ